MSPLSHPIALFIAIQSIVTVICKDLHVTCPSNPTTIPHTNPILSGAESKTLALDSSCFAMDIRLKVENILPDPTFISQETNIDIIQNALQKTLTDNGIDEFDITSFDDKTTTFTINNQCPHEKDETVNKFSFQKASETISCAETTLTLTGSSIQCSFKTPDSIVYIFNVESIHSLIDITGSNIIMKASIYNNIDKKGAVAQSDTTRFTNSNQIQEFVFSKQPTLVANTTYLLNISVISANPNGHEIKSVTTMPNILTTAEPNACRLAWNVADDLQMFYALSSLCHDNNIEKKKLFERVFYQKGSSQNYIAPLTTYGVRRRLVDHGRRLLDSRGRTRPTPPPDDGTSTNGTKTETGSLYKIYSNGTRTLIVNDQIFPNYEQCIAIDENTLRLFSVGGELNGIAMDRLVAYQMDSHIRNAHLIENNLKLSEPRMNTMCYYYKNDITSKEYVITINGMNMKGDQSSQWYNDIALHPVDGTVLNDIPKINLKHKLIDMTPVVTETNDLYLFGGRDGINAKNYIQMVDLNQVFDAKNSMNNEEFITMERMEPMVSNLVIPFVDFPMIDNQTCIMIFGGQDYVNNEWIDTEEYPNHKLQLYCNDNIVKNKFLFEPHNRRFTEFDRTHLKNVNNNNNFDDVKTTNNIFMTRYNFTNDSIWYEFDATFKLCFGNNNLQTNEQLTKILNVFDQNILTQNILTESRKNFQRWNDGFSKLNISDIHFIRAESTTLVTDCNGLSESICDNLIIASNGAVNGDKECAYNIKTKDCYSIQRAEGNNNDKTTNDQNAVEYLKYARERQSKLYIVIAIMCGIIIGLMLFMIFGGVCIYVKKRKVELDMINNATTAIELDGVNAEQTMLNSDDDIYAE